MRTRLLTVMLLSVGLTTANAQETAKARAGRSYPPQMPGCRVETYKTVGDTKLNLYVFSPSAPKNAPAIVFFFGGGWKSGTPQQFETQCRRLAERGMVTITADYRVESRHGVKPTQCLADARSAIRWVRAHADQLGVDPQQIAAGGGSAGGHLAACTPFITEFDEPNEDKSVSAVPNALVLFNPALVLAPIAGFDAEGFGTRVPEERMGTKPEKLSPAHHITRNGPPTIIFHGREDTTVPFASAEAFTAKMKSLGNRCELHGYEGQKHGFFNGDEFKEKTLAEADQFLVSLGWLKLAK
ncbi:MAG: Alpha/beta hydrolase fold-3 domain protein [Planctomycetota bacterium]|nr:MAG: Alpha/beta hydrolase fold-3 domain protein [Planctomycetota bacterium]